jgi:integrase
MPKRILTAKAVEKLRPPSTGQKEHWDAALPGFGLRVGENGTKAWVLMARLRGKLIRFTLGRHPILSLAQARDRAREAIRLVGEGEDPRSRWKEQEEGSEAGAFKTVAAEFLARSAQGKPSFKETQRIVNKELVPVWGATPIAKIGRRDVVAVLDEIIDRGRPIMANRTLGVISRIFSFALDRGVVDAHPCARMKRPGNERKRERVHTEKEIRALWKAFDHIGYPYGRIFQFLLVTAQRRGEAAGALRKEIDTDSGLWSLPRTKSGHGHEVPLSPQALQLLRGLPRRKKYVFSVFTGKPLNGFSKPSTTIRTLSGVADFRIHDLRRTAATFMARIGIPKITISRVLNHAEGGVTAIYARHGYLEEKRDALDRWGAELERILAVKDDADQPGRERDKGNSDPRSAPKNRSRRPSRRPRTVVGSSPGAPLRCAHALLPCRRRTRR